jgi:hypothetical protein
MPGYKLYFLDPSGHITHAVDLECEEDVEALEAVKDHPSHNARELWQRSRQVAVLPPNKELPAA